MNTQSKLPLEKYTGTYWAGLPGKVIVQEENGQLSFYLEDNPKLAGKLTHWHYDTWEIQWQERHAWFDFGTLPFQLDNNLKVTGLHFDVPNGDIFFDEVDLVREK